MRECWINVSVVPARDGSKEAVLGSNWPTREAAARFRSVDYRLHVRLKPEAATLEDLSAIMYGAR